MSIVGVSTDANGLPNSPLYWSSFTAPPQAINTTGLPNNTIALAAGINASGAIVGFSNNIINNDITSAPLYWSAFNTPPQPINTTGISSTRIQTIGINDSGAIVGINEGASNSGIFIPLYWSSFSAIPQVINTTGIASGKAQVYGINASGAIVGKSKDTNSAPLYWSSFSAIPQLINTTGFIANRIEVYGINASGAIVGIVKDANDDYLFGLYWSTFNAIPQVINTTGIVIGQIQATGINASGAIVGLIRNANGTFTPLYWSSFNTPPQILSTTGFANGAGAAGINDLAPQQALSNICFPAGTPITTDQGIVPIEQLDLKKHTIGRQVIKHITQTRTLDKYLIRFNKHALDHNCPNQTTIMSKDHQIEFEGRLVPAYRLLDFSDQVKKVKYNGEILYNVLLAKHSVMTVNNMRCETLHPDNVIAKIYTHGYTEAEQNNLIVELNTALETRDLHKYKKLLYTM